MPYFDKTGIVAGAISMKNIPERKDETEGAPRSCKL